jgi:hypothetical protein
MVPKPSLMSTKTGIRIAEKMQKLYNFFTTNYKTNTICVGFFIYNFMDYIKITYLCISKKNKLLK